MAERSLLLLAVGQSNADLYPAAPAFECDAFNDPHILTFNDGNGFRGLLGRSPHNPVTDLVPAGVEGQAGQGDGAAHAAALSFISSAGAVFMSQSAAFWASDAALKISRLSSAKARSQLCR